MTYAALIAAKRVEFSRGRVQRMLVAATRRPTPQPVPALLPWPLVGVKS